MRSVQKNSPNTVLDGTHEQKRKVLKMSTQQTNVLLEGLDPTENVVLRGRVPLEPRLNTSVCKTIGLV